MAKKTFLCFLLSLFYCFTAFSIDRDSTNKAISVFVLSINDNFDIDSSNIDTSFIKLHYLNPVLPNDHFFSYCSRSGMPAISNNVVDRIESNSLFFPLNSYQVYLQDDNNMVFYDGEIPFSTATYKIAGGTRSKQEFVEGFVTRKISKNSNIFLNYRLFSNKAEYDFQRANNHSLQLAYNKKTKNYFSYLQLYLNIFNHSENGGINSDSLINYKSNNFYGVSTNLIDAYTKLNKWGFQAVQKLFLFMDSSSAKSALTYNIGIDINKRVYDEGQVNKSIYNNYYSKTGSTFDSLSLSKIKNKIQLSLFNLNNSLPKLKFSLINNYYKSYHGPNIDTIFFNNLENKSKQIHSETLLNTSLYYDFAKMKFQVSYDYYFQGYSKGDNILNASTKFYFPFLGKSSLSVDAAIENKTPSFMMSNIFTNHFIWNLNLNKINSNSLKGKLYLDLIKTSVKFNYYLIKNFVYFNWQGIQQVDNRISILVFDVENLIKTQKLLITNHIVYQDFNNNFIQLPKLMIYNSIEFFHTFKFSTGGKLYSKLGFDFNYQSSFKPNTYIPSLGSFVISNPTDNSIKNTGDYVIMDVHLTFNVKNVGFYFKYSHFNSWFNSRYFLVSKYPILPAVFSYGIKWLFYD